MVLGDHGSGLMQLLGLAHWNLVGRGSFFRREGDRSYLLQKGYMVVEHRMDCVSAESPLWTEC